MDERDKKELTIMFKLLDERLGYLGTDIKSSATKIHDSLNENIKPLSRSIEDLKNEMSMYSKASTMHAWAMILLTAALVVVGVVQVFFGWNL
jgi:hypothetical protein